MRTRVTLILLAILLILGAAGWLFLGPSEEPLPPTPVPPDTRIEIVDRGEPTTTPEDEGEVSDQTVPPVDLDAADRDHDLFGIVLNTSDEPIARARVETIHYPWRGVTTLDIDSGRVSEAGPGTRTAADGTFSLRLERGQMVDLRVTARGYATTLVPQCQAGERVTGILGEGVNLEVVTTDEEGNPVPDVVLELWRLEDPRSGGPLYDRREGVTDSMGRGLFVDLQPGHGMLGLENAGVRLIQLPESGTLTLPVTLPAARTIRGRVTDAETSLPIQGARVGSNWVLDRPVETDEDGRYEFPGWTGRGVDEIHVIAEGYGRQGKEVPPEGDVDFALTRGYEATGRVVGADGNPVSGALVAAVASEHRARQKIDTRATRTRSDGTFLLTSLRRDFLSHRLVIQAKGHGRLVTGVRLENPQDDSVDLGTLILPEARWIEGVVLDSTFSPLPRVTVELHGPGVTASFGMNSGYGREEARKTDDLGRFRFPNLPPGRYFLAIKMKGRPAVARDVALPEDRDLLDVEIVIDIGASLVITVVDGAGLPIPGAHVRVAGARAKTDSRGWASIEGLPGSEVHVQVHPPDRSYLPPPRQVVIPAGQEVRFVLEKAAWVEGQVIGPDGEALPGMRLQVASGGGEPTRSVTCDATGSFSIACRVGEVVDIEVTGTGREVTALRGALRGIVAPASGVRVLTHEILMDRSLGILVQGPDGEPASEITVSLSGAGVPADTQQLTTDAEGRAFVEGLSAEPVRLLAHKPRGDRFSEDTLPFATCFPLM